MNIHQDGGHNDDHDTNGYSDEPQDGADNGYDASDEPVLVEDDEPLPWLESDYDDSEYQGNDTGRLIGFGLLGFLALALLLAAAWYFLRDRPDPALVPDGSTIEAPEGPVKERPEDAGGKEFEGTGNVAPTVGEGQTTEGRLGDDNSAKPSVDAAVGAAGASASSAPASGGVGVQVGAYGTEQGAKSAWSTLSGQTSALNGFKYRVVSGQVDGGTVYRLQAVAGDAASANKLCNALKADGIACQVK